MKYASALRSTTIALTALVAALASCTNGSFGQNEETAGATATAGAGGLGASAGGAPASGGASTAGVPGCLPGYGISDLEQTSEWASWSTTHDTTAGGTQTPAAAFMAEVAPTAEHYAAHTTGTGFTDWGAGLVLNPASAKKCLDFSKFTGVKFRAKGPANLIVAAQVPGVLPTTSGGTCTANCYDSHKTTVVVGADFADYTLYWSQFVQAGFGTPVVFKGADVTAFDFEVGPGDMPFNFWIDNVAFIDTPPVSGGGGATGAGGTTGASGSTGVAGSVASAGAGGSTGPTHKFSDVLTEQQFNGMFPNRNQFYSYAGLSAAVNKYNLFAAVGDLATQRREVAAFLANVARETASLKYIDEVSPQGIYCDSTNTTYKCASGQDYHGRGPLQISWNYNYGAAGAALGAPLLANPALVSSDATIAWETALWFWMTVTSGGRTAHTIMVQGAGFGLTINAINGQVECNGGNSQAVNDRVNFYKNFCGQLGVDPGTNLTC